MDADVTFTVKVRLLGGVDTNQHVLDRLHAAIHAGINHETLAEGVEITVVDTKPTAKNLRVTEAGS